MWPGGHGQGQVNATDGGAGSLGREDADKLRCQVVSAPSLGGFKRRLRAMWRRGGSREQSRRWGQGTRAWGSVFPEAEGLAAAPPGAGRSALRTHVRGPGPGGQAHAEFPHFASSANNFRRVRVTAVGRHGFLSSSFIEI